MRTKQVLQTKCYNTNMSPSKRLITQNKCFLFSICMHACKPLSDRKWCLYVQYRCSAAVLHGCISERKRLFVRTLVRGTVRACFSKSMHTWITLYKMYLWLCMRSSCFWSMPILSFDPRTLCIMIDKQLTGSSGFFYTDDADSTGHSGLTAAI